MSEKAFQDYWDHNDCWGCGAHNKEGLRIKSHWDGEEAVCIWTPGEHHKAGPGGYLNGGIIGVLIDCHCVCTAIADCYRAEGRGLDTEPFHWCVTASMNIDYKKPVPISTPVKLLANVASRKGRKIKVCCELYSGEDLCARGQVLSVKVPPEKWYG